MQNLLGKLKGGAEKATAEADRLRRLAVAQSELRSLQQQLTTATNALGRQALALFDAGRLTQPELLASCRQQVLPIQQRIEAQQALIEVIREERTAVPTVSAAYGHICPQCQIELPATAGFCPRCGSQAVDVAPPQPAVGARCVRCGTPLASGAQFCPACGARVAEAESGGAVCPSCRSPIRAGAAFCPNCGASLASAVQPETMPVAPVEVTVAVDAGNAVATPASGSSGEGVCPTCGTSLPAEAVFCPNCGTPREVPASTADEPSQPPAIPAAADQAVCATCGAALPAGVAFCPQCGASAVGGQGA